MKEKPKQEIHLPAIVTWLVKKKKQVIYSVGLAFFMGVLLYEYSPFFKQRNIALNSTEKAFMEWAHHSDDLALANVLRQKMEKQPSLKPKYQGILLQHLMNRQENVAEEAQEAIDRTKDLSLLYAVYANASLDIAKKDYAKALEKTLHLKEDLAVSGHHNSLLTAHTLLRLASLYKEQGQRQEELSYWNALETLLSEWQNSADYKNLHQKFTSGFANSKDIVFEDFILERKKAL